MVNKIKFSDVPLLKMISSPTNATLYIKLFDLIIYDYINGGIINVLNHWHDGVNHEVELITKCSNCRFLKENIETNDIVENRLYCTRYIQYSNISLSASITDNIVNLGMNKETFSCSFFEEKK